MIDAIDLASNKLIDYRNKYKKTHPNKDLPRLRILCFTDGVDTKSKEKPFKVARKLQNENIILDAVNVDNSINEYSIHSNILHQMAKSTRGKYPSDLIIQVY
jgi:hypothetical protein